MSDPQPARLKKKPARAEPLQPDRPGRGHAAASKATNHADSAKKATDRSSKQLREQSETARKNVGEGYDP